MTNQFPAATPASTVILVREAHDDFEVYLLKRSASSGFMAGKYVFPGGVVDETDGDLQHWLRHVDMGLPAIEECLAGGLDVQDALAHAVAAIRETFEEAGVLLASGEKRGVNPKACASRYRTPDDFREGWFRCLVGERNWQLELSRLHRWAHWITPRQMKRHYDTRFFVAAMPLEQTCTPDALETTKGIWMNPHRALEENLDGHIPLSPPTLVTLHQLSKFRTGKPFRRKPHTGPGAPRCARGLSRWNGGRLLWSPGTPNITRNTFQ